MSSQLVTGHCSLLTAGALSAGVTAHCLLLGRELEMYYDARKPIAVFLGPSLEKSHASQILTANYYPPARMGDIYRLLGSGIAMIVLIDGMFHNTASVWQRELLDALDNDILLVGAASMGALRAAELHPFGMVGIGTIFEWYRDGVIEGDDEVALHHADESNAFRPFSEPLVNIRYHLMQAVRDQIIDQEQSTELIRYAKTLYYADRSLDALLSSPVVKSWPSEVRECWRHFMRQQPINLKREDALKALNYARSNALDHSSGPRTPKVVTTSIIERNRYYRVEIYRQRGFLASTGELVSGEAILGEILKNKKLIVTLRRVLIKHFFLLLYAKQKHISCPADYLVEYKEQWKRTYVRSDLAEWLRANGLTEREFQSLLEQRGLLTWMLEQDPDHLAFDCQDYAPFWRALFAPQHEDEDQNGTLYWTQAKEICYLAGWAKENGVACPSSTVEKFIIAWEAKQQIAHRASWLHAAQVSQETYLATLSQWALAVWLVEKAPRYFGYTSWSFEAALIQELQLTGQAARIVKNIP